VAVERGGAAERGAAAERGEPESGGRETADAAVDIGALSQLYVGYTSVDEAVRSDGLTVDSPLGDDLRALFPPRTTHLREGF